MIKEVLEREYAALNLLTAGGSTEVNISGPRLRRFRSCADATSYIRDIAESIEFQVGTGPRPRHLPLIQTIDYLSYVLNDDPTWTPSDGKKLIDAPNLTSPRRLHCLLPPSVGRSLSARPSIRYGSGAAGFPSLPSWPRVASSFCGDGDPG